MLCLGEAPQATVASYLPHLIAAQPLAIAVFGVNSELAFDNLLQLLSTPSESMPHIMTSRLDEPALSDALDAFLAGTWPSSERFNEWDDYVIVVLGEQTFCEQCVVNAKHHHNPM